MTAQTILPANSVTGGFDVVNSAMFDGTSAYMHKTPDSGPSSADLFTISVWVKRCAIGSGNRQVIFDAREDAENFDRISINANVLEWKGIRSDSQVFNLTTNRVFRDPSAWYHLHFIWDSADGTADNRMRIYVNGVQETSFGTRANPSQNVDAIIGADGEVNSVGSGARSGDFWDGYMAEFAYLDGQELTPDGNTGEFEEDSGIWKPIKVSGLTFGTNGFYLDFQASGNLGNDANGGTDLTEVGFAATDQSTDTCTNNFATFNPLNNLGSNIAYSEGNLVITPGTSDYKTCISSIAVDSGKWYAEFKAVSGHNGSTDVSVGIVGADDHIASTGSKAMSAYLSSFSYGSGGLVKKYNNSTIRTDATYTDDDIIGIAVDMDNLKLYWSKNGTYNNSGDPTSGATGTGAVAITPAQLYYIAVATISSGGVKVFAANFGSPPYSESGGNSDADGHGNFLTAPPSGYFALNSKNLAEYGG